MNISLTIILELSIWHLDFCNKCFQKKKPKLKVTTKTIRLSIFLISINELCKKMNESQRHSIEKNQLLEA